MTPTATPPDQPQQEQAVPPVQAAPACPATRREEEVCPVCAATMRLWAGFYRCGQCGFKESCCF